MGALIGLLILAIYCGFFVLNCWAAQESLRPLVILVNGVVFVLLWIKGYDAVKERH